LEKSPDLFPASLTRAGVERDLSYWPQPAKCPLTLGNSSEWITRANAALQAARESIQAALEGKAQLLLSSSLRQRIEQGKGEPLIDNLLASQDVDELVKQLIMQLSGSERDHLLGLLEKFLKQVVVIKITLHDFKPSKNTLETGDVEQVVGEFRAFLQSGFLTNADDEFTIVEIE